MLERLAGRLKWEDANDGVRVVIPARLSWGAIRNLLEDLGVYVMASLGIFVIVGCVAYLRGLSFHSFLSNSGIQSFYFCSLGSYAGLILARTLPRLFGETVVTLNPAKFTIEWNAPLSRSTEVFPTATLQCFRFVESPGERPIQNKIGQNEIQFAQPHQTRSFGEGVTREEAEAFISKIRQVLPVPAQRPNEAVIGTVAKQL